MDRTRPTNPAAARQISRVFESATWSEIGLRNKCPGKHRAARHGDGMRRAEPSLRDQFELKSKLISFFPAATVAVKPELSGRVYFSGTDDFIVSGAFGSALYS